MSRKSLQGRKPVRRLAELFRWKVQGSGLGQVVDRRGSHTRDTPEVSVVDRGPGGSRKK